MEFRHERIDSNPPSMKLGFCLATDITGNGRDDVIVGARGRSYPGRRFVKQIENSPIPTFDDVRYRFGVAEVDLFWYENPGWKRHKMSNVSRLDVGASLGDINSNGRLDVVAGQGIHNNDVYWFEQPEDPRTEWRKHLVTDDFEKYHDLAVGDVDDDGQLELVGLSQESEVVFYYDIPDDPYEAPWPDEDRHIIAEDLDVEGVQIVDIDGDGQTEIIAGTSIFHQPTEPDRPWRREDITTILADVRVAVADLDQDGDLEVVFSEGDLPTYGSHLGRVAWFDPPDWEPTFLKEDLFGPHSLQVADFTGDGRQDVYVGEMALESNDDPKHFIFINQGGGEFEEHVIDHGIATHEAKVADLTGDGRPDIVGKSYGPNHHVDAWYNEG